MNDHFEFILRYCDKILVAIKQPLANLNLFLIGITDHL